jgi:DNA-binding transcriptional LysR family regulator
MAGDNFRDILAFIAVAKERSFTRAAAKLGVSQSALSHTIAGLEAKLGLRLLTRTTRSVSPTEAGERLIQRVGPRIEIITQELAALNAKKHIASGTVRITTSDFAFQTILWPKLSHFQPKHPEIKIEVAISSEFAQVGEGHFDAGVRFGDAIGQGMTSVRISPDVRMAVVGTPAYFDKTFRPTDPAELIKHDCINIRFAQAAGPYLWELKKRKRDLKVSVMGSWTFNSITPALDAALAGFGLAYMPEALARTHIQQGQLEAVLLDWCPAFSGLHIFYPERHQGAALNLIVEALRYKD